MISNLSHIDHYEEGEVVLSYEGVFSDDVTEESVTRLEKDLVLKLEDGSKLKNRIIYLFIEQFQNVIRHGLVRDNTGGPEGKIVITINKEACIIFSCNYCDPIKVKDFVRHIEELNNFSEIEIKDKFKHHLENNALSEKGGAGLGLLDMRRRTKNKIGVKLINENSQDCLFCLTLRLDLK